MREMKKNRTAFLIFAAIGSLAAAYFTNRVAALCLTLSGSPILNLTAALDSVWEVIKENPLYVSTDKNALIATSIAFAAVWLIVLYKLADDGNYMPGKEHGSAEWGTASDSRHFKNDDFRQNIILTQTEYMSIQPKFVKIGLDTFDPNHNVLIVGGPGSGKTRRYLLPNLMQMHSSYVITDPKGNLLGQTGKMLQDNGYTIRVLNLVDLKQSDHYNPFSYLKSDLDILRLVDNLMQNTQPENTNQGDSFWINQARGLFCALFAYLLHECVPEDRTMKNVLKLLLLADVQEGNDDFKTALDILFEDVEAEKPECFAVVQYKKFKQSKGRTASSILATANGMLDKFYVDEVSELTSKDDLEFDKLGDDPKHPVALFVILSDTNGTLNFLAAMMFQQLFDTLIWRADNVYHGALPCPVRFLLDEFKNIGKIPDFDKKLAVIRSRNISADIIIQSLSQLKAMYKDGWETIVGCCDSFLDLGSIETFTNKYITELIGKATVDNKNTSESKGMNGSYSLQSQILGRELITPDELARLHSEQCVLIFAHRKPFLSLKYEPTKHPNAAKTTLTDKNNWFDLSQRIEKAAITAGEQNEEEMPAATNEDMSLIADVEISNHNVDEINALTDGIVS